MRKQLTTIVQTERMNDKGEAQTLTSFRNLVLNPMSNNVYMAFNSFCDSKSSVTFNIEEFMYLLDYIKALEEYEEEWNGRYRKLEDEYLKLRDKV